MVPIAVAKIGVPNPGYRGLGNGWRLLCAVKAICKCIVVSAGPAFGLRGVRGLRHPIQKAFGCGFQYTQVDGSYCIITVSKIPSLVRCQSLS